MTQPANPFEFDAAEEARFRAAFAAAFGSLDSAAGSPMAVDWMPSPVGPLLLGASEQAILVVEFASTDQLDAQFERLRKHFHMPLVHEPAHSLLIQVRGQLAEYFDGERRNFELPLEYHGSPFQERVWTALKDIPYAQTCSYAAIARAVGDVKATRAVGTANGLNPISIVIPCHRVVNANGDLGGYGGGRWRKQILLDLEQGQGRLF